MYRVLVPIDDNEARTEAQIEAVSSLPDVDNSVEATLLRVFPDRETAESTSVTRLLTGRKAKGDLTANGIAVETTTSYGDPAKEILTAADEIGADLIVLGGRKRSSLGSFLFGSVSQAVLLDATRPVAITGGTAESEPSGESPTAG